MRAGSDAENSRLWPLGGLPSYRHELGLLGSRRWLPVSGRVGLPLRPL